ncbi:MAG: hypothetical protein RIT26_1928 [Pseudomonadota bacterium]|jgi:UDP-2,3-diacylglucosamine hydrolase
MADTQSSALVSAIDGRAWTCIDWVSDLHLQAAEPRTAQAFFNYLKNTPAQALFVLGDLFEVWVGDDVLQDPGSEFERSCTQALARASERLRLFWLPGNRDFLTGSGFVRASGATALAEYCQLTLPHEVCVLCHGDSLCLQDHDYMAFRGRVRGKTWQQAFLNQPLAQRQAQARQMREQSMAAHADPSLAHVDVDADEARRLLRAHAATRMIHGHTHRPADHDLGQGLGRTVLSDWCLDTLPARAEVLRWHSGPPGGWQRLAVAG